MPVHPTAVIFPGADLAKDAAVGPYAIIESGARVGPGCIIAAHAQLLNQVILGPNCRIGSGAVLGGDPQDLRFDPLTPSGVELGAHCVVREHATIHRSAKANGFTKAGEHNFLMVGSHLGHDCVIGDHNVIANNVMLGGHVTVGNRTFLGGGAGFHQGVRVGDYCMVQGNSAISQDVPPYVMAALANEVHGLNVIGIRRAGYSPEIRSEIKRAYDLLFRGGLNLSQALEEAAKTAWGPEAARFIDFFKNASSKGVCRPPNRG